VGVSLDFGLSGAGEMVRLFDAKHTVIDSLTYDDKEPWPEEPDGGGSSLSLRNPYLDNSLSSSWAASRGHGTPGEKNDVFTWKIDDNLKTDNNYPNPFKSTTTITFSLSIKKRVRVDIYNISGQRIASPLDTVLPEGTHNVLFDGNEFSCGIYFFRISTNTSTKSGKMLLLR